jgi:hypothetical protein
MSVTAMARPDLSAYLDAYRILEVDYSADPAAIRRARRTLARRHHPDRYSAGSIEQHEASARIVAMNDASRLIRNAPLRYHRISEASDPDRPWTEDELDVALNRAHAAQLVDRAISGGLAAAFIILSFQLMMAWNENAYPTALGSLMFVVVNAAIVAMMVSAQGRRFRSGWMVLDAVLALGLIYGSR